MYGWYRLHRIVWTTWISIFFLQKSCHYLEMSAIVFLLENEFLYNISLHGNAYHSLSLSTALLLRDLTCSLKFSIQLSWWINEEWGAFFIVSLVFSFHLPRVVERSLDQGPTFSLVFSHQWMRNITFLSINYFPSQLSLNLFKWSCIVFRE